MANLTAHDAHPGHQMICCLLLAALLAPFGLRVAEVASPSGAACCTNRRMLFFAAAIGVSVAVASALLLMLPQTAPFHHICRFIAVPRG